MNTSTTHRENADDLGTAQRLATFIECPIEDGEGRNCREDMIRTAEQALTQIINPLARDLLMGTIEKYRPGRYSV